MYNETTNANLRGSSEENFIEKAIDSCQKGMSCPIVYVANHWSVCIYLSRLQPQIMMRPPVARKWWG